MTPEGAARIAESAKYWEQHLVRGGAPDTPAKQQFENYPDASLSEIGRKGGKVAVRGEVVQDPDTVELGNGATAVYRTTTPTEGEPTTIVALSRPLQEGDNQ